MAWPSEYIRDDPPWLNPWPNKMLLPVWKWWPIYWPNETWEIVGLYPNREPVIPNGVLVPWWKQARDMWPPSTVLPGAFRYAPFEEKVFGAWPASQISMPEDFQNYPPFGYIKCLMPGQQLTKEQQISFMHLKAHMRYWTLDQMRMMTINTKFGTRFYIISKNWGDYNPNDDEPKNNVEFYKFIGEKPKLPSGNPDLFA
jgi:hypothetical protein